MPFLVFAQEAGCTQPEQYEYTLTTYFFHERILGAGATRAPHVGYTINHYIINDQTHGREVIGPNISGGCTQLTGTYQHHELLIVRETQPMSRFM